MKDKLSLIEKNIKSQLANHPFTEDFDGILSELISWYVLGNDEQKELLIISLRNFFDLIAEKMPEIPENVDDTAKILSESYAK